MKRNTRLYGASAAVLLLAGCANTTFHIPFLDHGDAAPASPYADARAAIRNQPLDVPPGLSPLAENGTFGVPGLNGRLTGQGQQVIESNAVLPKFVKVKMATDGESRWLEVDAKAEAVYPVVRQFWLDEGYKLVEDDPLAGLLKTDWRAEHQNLPAAGISLILDSSGRLDQFSTRLDRGDAPDSTDIFISYRGMKESTSDDPNVPGSSTTRWIETGPQPEVEAAELQKLLVRLGVSADVAGQVIAQQGVATPAEHTAVVDRASLLADKDGHSYIQINETFDRAWRRVGQALERAGYTIADRDRSLGVYYVRPTDYKPKDKETGTSFWSKMAFWRSTPTTTTVSMDDQGPEYLVNVTSKDTDTRVTTGARKGGTLPADVSAKLLKALTTELR